MKRARGPQARRPPSRAARRSPLDGRALLWLGAVLAVTFAAYIPSLKNGFINWDDNYYVTDNPLMRHPTLHGILTTNQAGNYHPLTMASLVLNYKLSGMNASSYHWLNLLLHLANTALVFFFIRKLSGGRLWASLATALFFGIHPMHVESVAWISERKDVLYALFYLIALIAYLRFLDARRGAWLIATWLAFALSCASKPAAVVLPLTLFAIDHFRGRPFNARTVLEKVPFFVVSVGVGLLTFMGQKDVGAIAASTLWSPFQRMIFASVGSLMYVVKLFLPLHLSAVYPLPATSAKHFSTGYYLAPVILVVGLAAIAFFFRRVRPVIFGVAFFFINIVLVLQLVTVGAALMAERYTYVPYIGLFFALAWWLDEPASARGRSSVKAVVASVFLLLLPVSLVQTWQRCRVWRDPETFWNDTIQKYPRRIVDAYYNRGNYYVRQGRFNEGLADYDEAIALNPNVLRIWYNKGLLLANLDRNDSALVAFDRAVQIAPTNVDALNNRGAMKYRKRDFAGSAVDYTRAIERNPRFRDAYLNRAVAYTELKEYEKSAADRRHAIELDPANPGNVSEYAALGETLQKMGRHQEAIAAFDRAIAGAGPEDAKTGVYHLVRSYSWSALRDRARALADAREAQRLGAMVDPAYLRSLGG